MIDAKASKRRGLSPSLKAKKILCKGYEPSEFPKGREGDRLRWKHSDEMKCVMKKLLKDGYQILDVEAPANGGRIDLVAKATDGRIVGVEVKSHRGELKEVDRIQAALYYSPQLETVAVANRYYFEILSAEYVQEVRVAAHITEEFLETQPDLARVSFTPHIDVCGTCSNGLCLYRESGSVQMRLTR